MNWKRILLIAAALLTLTSAGNAQHYPGGKYQSCRGVLTKVADAEIYLLSPDPGSGDWCDADIVEKYAGADAIERVLNVCKIGGRCQIKGRFYNGRRVVWSNIQEVTRP
jgi:hypothetical protein